MSSPPNVLCISVDSLRADYCSFTSDRAGQTTPFLASFAEEATTYTRAIAPSTWTLQVHASIFTGLYPPEHQVLDNGVEIGDHPTLAQLFRKGGYETCSFGWNGWLEQGGVLRGFDHHRSPEVDTAEFARHPTLNGFERKIRKAMFRHTWRDEHTIEALRDRLEMDSSSPFFHFVHLNGVHWPYHPPHPHHRAFTRRTTPQLTWNLIQQRKLYEQRPAIYTGERSVSPRISQGMRELYSGCVHYADSLIQDILAILEQLGDLENTVIVLFGDHGDDIGENGNFGHHFTVSDAVIRVPMLVYDPTNTLESGIVDDVVQTNDIFPTLLDICEIDGPITRSRSLASDQKRETAFVYYSAPKSFLDKIYDEIADDELPPSKQYVAWQSPAEKTVAYPDDGWQIAPESSPDYRQLLSDHESSLEPVASKASSDLSDSVRSNLEQMGYI